MVWTHTILESTKEQTVASCPLPPSRIPKFERLRRLAERNPELGLDLPILEAYVMMIALASEVMGAAGTSLARHGLGEGRFSVLALLLENQPEPMSHSELAEIYCVTKGSITGLVDGLEHDGYVKREDSGADRRVRSISLTPVGRQLVEQVLPDHFRRIVGLMAGLSPSECKTLVTLLAKVQDGLPAFKLE
jgi:DNA-binding MarR family transcriptional regulator